MPFENFQRINLDLLYLPFISKLLEAIAACNARGSTYRATLGYRTFQEQAKLYFQGRTQPGPIVTDAPAGYSAHNYGLAVDFVRMLPSGKVSWDSRDYQPLGEEAERQGLVWGGSFKHPDFDHVQLTGYVDEHQLLPLRAVYLAHQDAPLSHVFQHLDSLPT